MVVTTVKGGRVNIIKENSIVTNLLGATVGATVVTTVKGDEVNIYNNNSINTLL